MSADSFGSLERFVKTRGSMFLGSSYPKRAATIQTWVGATLLSVAGIVAISPLLGAPVEALFGTIGPFIAGTINLGFGIGMRKRFSALRPVETALSSEARQVLLA